MKKGNLSLRALRASCGVSALMFFAFSAPAFAQGANEDIVVVAQKRSENIQDVPISVSVVQPERLASAFSGGADILALSAAVPGLNVESSNGRAAPRFYIRGLGNIDFDLAASQPVSVVMDDIVMENVTLKSFPLFDIKQIEVSRGPQGTLFGRNTTAGVINIISARPTKEFEAQGSLSYGSYSSISAEGAVSGPLVGDTLMARMSLMYKHRDNWIDNTYTGPGVYDDELGGFDDIAGRLQLLFQPNDQFSALLNVHARSLDGQTASVFRANIFDKGSNDLNANFDRDKVFYNGGAGNNQKYDQTGAGLTMSYDFGGATLTSITGYETVDGFSRGDIDGGVAGVGPGFIPFDSDTQDSVDDATQFTQEIRLASPDAGPVTWQVGAFYFDSKLPIITVGGALSPAEQKQTNESWAIFGQGTWAATDRLKLTAGVRYTEDDKTLTSPATATVKVSDEFIGWDVSANYELTSDFSVYARAAEGYRGPSIQGRDIAFFGTPSVADSEKALSFEVGTKAVFDKGRISAAVFHYEVSDMQLTVIGGASNANQLVNADKGEGYGFEIEGDYQPVENLLLTAGFNYTHTEIKDGSLLVIPCGANAFNPTGNCTVRDRTTTVVGGFPAGPVQAAYIDGNPFPQAPKYTIDFTARYSIPASNGGEWFAFTDWAFRGPLNFTLYDATEFKTDMQFEGGLKVGYAAQDGAYEVAAFARNITNEENVIGVIDFNNLTGFVNEPRIIGVSFSAKLQ